MCACARAHQGGIRYGKEVVLSKIVSSRELDRIRVPLCLCVTPNASSFCHDLYRFFKRSQKAKKKIHIDGVAFKPNITDNTKP